ncbi:MAG TPA: hypothetical protein VJ850_05265 [Candidatus Limnocylindrales bacterium]|nr:hypothetical protein [Candidatus Limnocylindrales bacterium]
MTGSVHGWARDTETLAEIVKEAEPGFFEHRAVLAFRALAVIYLFGIVLAFFHEPGTLSLLLIVGYNGAAFLLVITYLVLARSLRILQPWAVAVARPVLVLIVLQDAASFVVGVLAGHIRGLPVAAVIAAWALLGPAGVRPIPRPRVLSVLAFLLALPLLATLLFAKPVFDWGGALDVQPADLAAHVSASCERPAGSPSTTTGSPTARVHVTYDWAWSRSSPVPNGLDIVVIGWTGNDVEGRPIYFIGPTLPTEPGIYDGRRRFPSLELGNVVAAQSQASWQWGVELDEHGFTPGRIELDLDRGRNPVPGARPLRIVVSYVHLGQWHADTVVTCSW